MFSFMKKRDVIKKYLLIFFLGIVSLSMVVVMAPLPSGDTSTPQGNVLASIGGNTITSAELDQTIRDRFKNSPMGFDKRMIPMVAPSVLDQMVTEQILTQQAAKMGVEVSDQELLKTFQGIPWLYPDGNFVGADRAAEMVAQQTGKTLAQFESMLRDSLLEEKIRSIVTDDVQVTPAEVLAEFRHRNAKAKIDYVLFDPSQFIKDVKVTPEALDAFFKKDPAHYKLPEATPGALCGDRSRPGASASEGDGTQNCANTTPSTFPITVCLTASRLPTSFLRPPARRRRKWRPLKRRPPMC